MKSTCATITGCNFRDAEATKTVDACTLNNNLAVRATGTPQAAPEKRALFDWKCDDGGHDGVIWPLTNDDAGQQRIIQLLDDREAVLGLEESYIAFRADELKFTAFYWVKNMGPRAKTFFSSNSVNEVS